MPFGSMRARAARSSAGVNAPCSASHSATAASPSRIRRARRAASVIHAETLFPSASAASSTLDRTSASTVTASFTAGFPLGIDEPYYCSSMVSTLAARIAVARVDYRSESSARRRRATRAVNCGITAQNYTAESRRSRFRGLWLRVGATTRGQRGSRSAFAFSVARGATTRGQLRLMTGHLFSRGRPAWRGARSPFPTKNGTSCTKYHFGDEGRTRSEMVLRARSTISAAKSAPEASAPEAMDSRRPSQVRDVTSAETGTFTGGPEFGDRP